MIDLGFSGPRFTWSNLRPALGHVKERLDRALSNADWRLLFPEAIVQHLPRTYSDHCPLLVDLSGIPIPNPHLRPFRFEACWLLDDRYKDLVNQVWHQSNLSLPELLPAMVQATKDWNLHTFGNLFRNKRRLLTRIAGIQKALDRGPSHFLIELERDLINQYNRILKQEKFFWYQKSRVRWMLSGDRNTQFYHVSTMVKRR